MFIGVGVFINRIRKMCYICIMVFYVVIKEENIILVVGKFIDLEVILVGE